MKAVVVREFGPPESIRVEDCPEPVAGPDRVLVDVHAAGMNFPDLLVMAGRYQILPPLPFVPGKECAGVVVSVPEGAEGLAPGDRVLVWMEHGAFAERVAAPPTHVFRIPPAMSFDEAAGFGLVYQTAHFALLERARTRPGDVVLVTGASGGVGLAAVQVAKALGATVVAAVSTPEKAATVRHNGADHVVDVSVPNLRDALREQLRAVTGGRGADVVVEQVGGDVFEASLRSLAWCGRLVVVGFAGGRIPEVRANYLLVKNIAVLGLQISDYRDGRPDAVRAVMTGLFDLYREGAIRPQVSAGWPLARFAQGYARMRAREAVGRMVLRVR